MIGGLGSAQDGKAHPACLPMPCPKMPRDISTTVFAPGPQLDRRRSMGQNNERNPRVCPDFEKFRIRLILPHMGV
jgi:hypothetical protein